MTQNTNTFHETLHDFENLEQELELPKWTINDVYIWKLLRHRLFREYRERRLKLETAHPEKQKLKSKKTKHALKFLSHSFTNNPFLARGLDVQRIIIPGGRKIIHQGQYINPISYSAWKPPHNQNSIILERHSPLYPKKHPEAFSYDFLRYLGHAIAQTVHVSISDQDQKIISDIESFFYKASKEKPLELAPLIKNTVKSFVGNKIILRIFLAKFKPRYLYIVCGYGLEAPISAAHELGIKTVEFQHGPTTRGHVGYDFKRWNYVPYFPDHMLAFGHNWYAYTHFPSHCVIDPVGYPLLEDKISLAKKHTQRNPKQLLILSQGPFANIIIIYAAEFAARRPDWHIVIRPHPSESPESLQNRMQKITCSQNWHINKESTLEENTNSSSVALGVSSTSIIQALLAGCRVAILDIPQNTGYFDLLVSEGNASKVESGQELAEVIDDLPTGNARGYFSEPVRDIVNHVEKSH